MTFGKRLKQLRTEKGLTQKQLASETSTSERAIQNYEMGVRNPAYDVLITLADFFDVPVGLLAGAPGANLSKANLSHADMREIKACGALFIEADLSFADLRSADLRWADFTDADLHMARLNGANITGAVFTGADVSGTILDVKT